MPNMGQAPFNERQKNNFDVISVMILTMLRLRIIVHEVMVSASTTNFRVFVSNCFRNSRLVTKMSTFVHTAASVMSCFVF